MSIAGKLNEKYGTILDELFIPPRAEKAFKNAGVSADSILITTRPTPDVSHKDSAEKILKDLGVEYNPEFTSMNDKKAWEYASKDEDDVVAYWSKSAEALYVKKGTITKNKSKYRPRPVDKN